jgi:mono/diheme cytochrome c family protein
MISGIFGALLFGVFANAVCAQTPGEGRANKQRDLGSADVQKQSDDELNAIISRGKGKMPAYGKSLKPEQIKELVAYIRTLKK